MAPRIKMIVNLNLLWSEFAETKERCFDLLLHVLEAGRNVAISFRKTRSKVSLKFTIMNDYFVSKRVRFMPSHHVY